MLLFSAACSKVPEQQEPTVTEEPTEETPANPDPEAFRITNYPSKFAVAGTPWTFRPVLSRSGSAKWQFLKAPSGARMIGDVLQWNPTDQQGGRQTFTLRGWMDGLSADLTFTVEVAALKQEAAAQVDPSNPNGSSVSIDAPLSPVKGSAVVLAPGSLSSPDPVQVTISSVTAAPVPLGAQLSGLGSSDLKPVEFGPSGLTFAKPVTIYVPVSQAVLAKGNPTVQTYDFQTGQWESVPVIAVDTQAGVVAAEVRHFSLYVGTASRQLFDIKLSQGGRNSGCPDSLLVRAPMQIPFADLPASQVNGQVGQAQNVRELLSNLQDGATLQILTRINAKADAQGGGAWHIAAATRSGNEWKIQLASNSQPGGFHATSAASPDDAEAWLQGGRHHALIPLGKTTFAAATVDATFYALPPGTNPLALPVSPGNTMGTAETASFDPVPALDDHDDDCDGLANTWDTAQTAVPASIAGSPPSPVRVLVGGQATLTVSTEAGVALSWTPSDTSLSLAPSADGRSATVSPNRTGTFTVTVTADKAGAKSSYAWQVLADSAAAPNTPPRVSIAVSPSLTVRAGDRVTFDAIASDAEQAPTALIYAWTFSGATSASNLGKTLQLTFPNPGDYTVTSMVSDGTAQTNATVTVSVLPLSTNRAPEPPVVTPLSATFEHDPGTRVYTMFNASGRDPDGDPVTFTFTPSPQNPGQTTFSQSGNLATFSAVLDGSYVFYVRAVDDKGAESAATLVKVLLTQKAPPTATDSDGDGYASNTDCNDSNRAIHPGAYEVCADGIDQDCSGADKSAAQCDYDGDRVSTAQGDCDDADPSRFPGAYERCDGKDNDCDGAADETFAKGAACTVGVGACSSTGTLVCNATGSGTYCSAPEKLPVAETCNQVDDDCDGAVDDVPSDAGSNDPNNCGGCGRVCSSGANAAPVCQGGGCGYTCQAGFVDVDRSPGNGCECAKTGAEVCDGLDNDCDGAVDEDTAQSFYTGPTGTAGVGVCSMGWKACSNATLQTVKPERTPGAEACNGVDDDCDGAADESWSFATDRNNCGGCGVVCSASATCTQGRCVTVDGGTSIVDAGSKTDAGTSGDGGIACPPGGATCGNSFCINLTNNVDNCGACGYRCPGGYSCQNSACYPTGADAGTLCEPGYSYCQGATGGACLNTMSDPSNCGSCGYRCGTSQTCQSGVCRTVTTDAGTSTDAGVDAGTQADAGVVSCPTGSLYCAAIGRCTEILYDRTNCGACGNVCAAGASCVQGQCQGGTTADAGSGGGGGGGSDAGAGGGGGTGTDGGVSCPPDTTYCATAGRCTEILYDNSNCGACGNICKAGDYCQQGQCTPTTTSDAGVTCAPDDTYCGTQLGCRNLYWDSMSCGACGYQCATGTTCQVGTCVGGTTADAGSGGGGGTGSDAGAGGGGGTGTDGGAVTCGAGQAMCDGACRDLRSNIDSCGACGYMCPSGYACQDYACYPATTSDAGSGLSCPPASTSCSSPTGDLFCTNTQQDPGNCGACGRTCTAGNYCSNGACVPSTSTDAGSGGGGGTGTDGGAIACPTGTQYCGAQGCVNVFTDNANCGACGNLCKTGDSCQNGQCLPSGGGGGGGTGSDGGVSCPPDTTYCTASGSCVNLYWDNLNCGSCGYRCASGSTCQVGTCVWPSTDGGAGGGGGTGTDGGVTCPTGTQYCSAQGSCVEVMVDPNNCGFCGNKCAPGATCSQGTCTGGGTTTDAGTTTCGAGQAMCDGACRDIQSNIDSCGACGYMCPAGFSCQNMACYPASTSDAGSGMSCPPASTSCSSPTGDLFCTSTQQDPSNCGACGNVCGAGTYCSNGACVVSPTTDGGAGGGGGTGSDGGTACMPDDTYCGPELGCRNLYWDSTSCGTCGYRCGAGMTCQVGVCVSTTTTDGGSGGGGGTGGDDGGVSCPSGMQYCATVGGCIDPMYDRANCGGCGIQCSATQACQSGVCVGGSTGGGTGSDGGTVSCTEGQGYCNGACTDIRNNNLNCGACGYTCQSGFTCQDYACYPATTADAGTTASCQPASSYCTSPSGDTFCADTRRDSNNCGACNNSCGAGNYCENSFCRPAPTSDGGTGGGTGSDGGVDCGAAAMYCPAAGGCVDIMFDPNNCGGCGNTCGAGQSCQQGQCTGGSTGGGDAGMACQPFTSRSCYTGPAGTSGIGVCRGGMQYCNDQGQWNSWCEGEIVPRFEACGDNQDNDCDGTLDDGCPLALNPPSLLILTGDSFTFTAAGGQAPYSWSLPQAQSGGQLTVVNGNGSYVAGASNGEDRVRVSDSAGAVSEASITVNTDNSVTLSPSGGTFNSGRIQLVINTVANTTGNLRIDGQDGGAGPLPNGRVSLTMNLTPGTHVVEAHSFHPSGRNASASGTFVYDNVPPATPVILSPATGETVSGPQVQIAGAGESGSNVDVLGTNGMPLATVTVAADGGFSASPTLVTGQHRVTARAMDNAGNKSGDAAPVQFTVTNGTPAALSPYPTSAQVGSGQTISFLATGGTPPYTWSMVPGADGGTSASVTPSGAYTAGAPGIDTVRVTDALGDSATATVNVQPPLTVNITSPTNGMTVPTMFQLQVVTNPYQADVVIYVDNMVRGGGMSSPYDGRFNFDLSLPPGMHALRATASKNGSTVSSQIVNVEVMQ